MRDGEKTKKQLVKEVADLLGRVARLEKNAAKHKRIERALSASEKKYQSLVESTDDSIYLVDRAYKYVFINKKHLSRMGLPKEKLLGRPYSEFHSPEETHRFMEQVDRVFQTGQSTQYEHMSERDGMFFLRTLSPVKEEDGSTAAVTVISKNISRRKGMEEKLRTLSLTDELTGLYNRRGFFTLAEQQLRIANRLKKGIFMIYTDLDNLKTINDTLGHGQGDQALMDTANMLKETFRESDIIARIGGDEFALIPVELIESSVSAITARLQRSLDKYNAKAMRGYRLSLSMGTAYYDPERPISLDELLKEADRSMYEQKKLRQKT